MPAKMLTARTIGDLVASVARMAKTYAADLDTIKTASGVPVSSLSLPEFFKWVRGLGEYRRDAAARQITARPKRIVELAGRTGKDCKKSAVLIGSYCEVNKIPWRLVTMSARPDRQHHHIFPQVLADGAWINHDATLKRNRIGEPSAGTSHKIWGV